MILKASLALLTGSLCLGALDLRHAAIRLRPEASPIERKAALMIAGEIEKRTQLRLTGTGEPAISIARGSGPADGFTLTTSADSVEIRGNDDRGVIFGAGYFLRQLRMSRQTLEIPAGLHVTSAPKIAIRGHQLGYRPKTN
ncbi:MAG TPA: hypothetical protein VHB50_14450, partial [Bryobacteraceae bacterium]|nr:hypothetical protein [Bryobacteraceae bacterium]